MREETDLIGNHGHLVATLTHVDPAREPAGPRTGCLLMSAGVVHRIGPHRFNVKLARALALAGIPAIRLDLAAVGDSRVPPVDTPYEQQAVIDLRAAIDHLIAQTGVSRVVVIGLCTGAVQGLRCALSDDRVAGVAMIDGYAYPTVRTRRERWLQRMRGLDHHMVARSLRARVDRLRPDSPARATPPTPAPGSGNPPREALADDLLGLLKRKVSIYQVFTGSILQHYNYANQFRDGFAEWPELAAIRTEYLPDIDHTFTTIATQSFMIERLSAWALSV